MNIYHIRVQLSEDDWYILQAVEDDSIFTQARTLDEAVVMVRDVLDLMKDEKDAELRFIIPANLPVDDSKSSGRFTDPVDEDESGPVRTWHAS